MVLQVKGRKREFGLGCASPFRLLFGRKAHEHDTGFGYLTLAFGCSRRSKDTFVI
jgi:hypothetical protein